MKYQPTDIYNIYINSTSVQEPFIFYYAIRNTEGSISLMDQQFTSKDETYCLSLLDTIMNSSNFIGFPFPCVNFLII
jgi:hypothetical protein